MVFRPGLPTVTFRGALRISRHTAEVAGFPQPESHVLRTDW
jgi:hypothetical protein